jgi:serine/threonine-protein kinase RsbW
MMGDSSREPELELSFPPRPEYVRAARHAVAALARLHDASDNTVEDVRLAVSEACTSAVQANAETGQDVRLTATIRDSSLVVDVLDRGAIIDPGFIEHVEEVDTDELPFEKQLSLPLLRGLVDRLEGFHRDGGGMVIRMWMSVADGEDADA